jgi:hypothetical protein
MQNEESNAAMVLLLLLSVSLERFIGSAPVRLSLCKEFYLQKNFFHYPIQLKYYIIIVVTVLN